MRCLITKDVATYRAILKRNGFKVVSAMEIIFKGPEGIIFEAILEGMSEYYSAELSIKVKFTRYANGETVKKISEELNSSGVF